MKSVFKSLTASFALLLVLLMASFSAKAADCSATVGSLCKAYDEIAAKMSAADDLQQLIAVDLDKRVQEVTRLIDKDCYSYVLTAEDKASLVKSFDNVFVSLVDKANQLTGGTAGAMLDGELQPVLNQFHESMDRVVTLEDYMSLMK